MMNPVVKTITVKASPAKAFQVFTEGIDGWWPRTHHIGKCPMKKSIVEGHPGGRCYTEQEDGSESDWGEILIWDPPQRFVMAWKITPHWGYEPDPAKASEVEVKFTPIGASTRIDLEHRHLERHGDGAETMRSSIDSPGGWSGLLAMYAAKAEAE